MKCYPSSQSLLNQEDMPYRAENESDSNNKKAVVQDIHKNPFITAPKILLVEDEPIIQRIHTLFLEQLGAKVELAKNGAEALRLFPQDYDLILLDIGLPDMTGIEVAKYIRTYEQINQIRPHIIIALTAFGELMKEKCLAVGFNDFYAKPIPIERFTKALKCWLPQQVKPELVPTSKLDG